LYYIVFSVRKQLLFTDIIYMILNVYHFSAVKRFRMFLIFVTKEYRTPEAYILKDHPSLKEQNNIDKNGYILMIAQDLPGA